MKLAFLFSQHRGGSKLLCSLLDSHPDIICPHELLESRTPVSIYDAYLKAARWELAKCINYQAIFDVRRGEIKKPLIHDYPENPEGGRQYGHDIDLYNKQMVVLKTGFDMNIDLMALNAVKDKLIILHGHYGSITAEMMQADAHKVFLYRDDVVLHGVKQSVMGINRLHNHYDMPIDIAVENTKSISEKNKALEVASTFKFSYERLTKGRDITKMPSHLNKRLLAHLGVSYKRLRTNIRKEAPMLPKNLGDIYGEYEKACAS